MNKLLANLLLLAFSSCLGSSMASAAADTSQITLSQVQSIVGKMMVPKYNSAKTSAALVGKTLIGTLNLPINVKSTSDSITTRSLLKARIYFTCNDFPNGLPAGTKTYNVAAKIIKFEVDYAGDSDDFATITLDKCGNTVAKTALTSSPSTQPSIKQLRSSLTAKSASVQNTLDEQFDARKSAECASGFGGLICQEKIRFAMCTDKWSENPPSGQSTCRGASTKQ